MIGKSILHYNILEKLGEGGMGVVYKAEDTKLKREVAIKFLPHHISSNEEERKRFKIEAQAAAALNHPNISTIHSIEESGSEVFIVMEYIEAVELKDKIKSGPIQTDEAINIAKQIAEGLDAAHKKGIVHRDIKSQNIMITNDGKVKIMDFGLAKIKGGSEVTKLGTTLGTVGYMSPEQAKGEEVDNRTDIWSFGIVLYEMLTGQLPFKGDYDQAIIYSILNEEPALLDSLPLELEKILSKSLQKNPEDRYKSADDFADELSKISEGRSVNKDPRQSNRQWIFAGTLATLIAVVLYLFIPSSNKVEEYDKNIVKTIAVLPFLDLSPKNDQEYFSDGLSEELLNVLAQNSHLRVISRTSAFSFRGKEVDIKTIASKLKVKHILEGSVRKAGNTLRITAQLIDAEADAHLWSKIYDGTMENIFALQDSISGSVAEALKITLLGKENKQQKRVTVPEAYNVYLLGKHFYSLRGKSNWENAAGYYKEALSIDSNYAPAWVGLSKVHSSQADYGYQPVDESFRKARREVEKALTLDSTLADAHSQIGWIKRGYDWDWTGADESYRRALELDPGNASIITNTAVLSFTMGRVDEAIELTRHSIELNPLSTARYNNLGYGTLNAGLLDESEMAFKKSLELNPQYPGGHMQIGLVYFVKGNLDLALVEMMKETEPDWQMYGLALVYNALGRKKEADEKLAEFIKDHHYDSAYQIAQIYACRNEADKAFEWLDRAYNQRDGRCSEIKGDILLHKIEQDPRYAEFLKKMKLPL